MTNLPARASGASAGILMERDSAVISKRMLSVPVCVPGRASTHIPERGRVKISGKSFIRDAQKLRMHGVTYGPFAANELGEPFPSCPRVRADFQQMRSMGVNAIRTYHLPPDWFLRLADEQGLLVLIDVPWAKHLCFLDSARAQREAREAVRHAVTAGRGLSSVLAYSICNEIPPSIVRWHGARRVGRFLEELADVARQLDPECLVTSASFPPTEYLDLSFADFATFNVYLHNNETFRRYLFRLQNLVGDRPLLLGELGMDTLRNGEPAQAKFLSGHLEEVTLMGLAGAFVFSWTDEWHTGGYDVQNWAFGITTANRRPKAACAALDNVFDCSPARLLLHHPRVSVVVCTYNGGATLEQCLCSLRALDYPNYEIVVVDDGSTDSTIEILKRFPSIRAIRQDNHGLSVARNVGLHAATGEIVAYTDSDCFADPDWLSHLVYQFQRGDAAAVGGPNITPEDGWLAACVAAAPGQPTHVLESDQVAEHIPGCNMAFRRDALEQINGFDPQFRKAGDDVDVCWRLQQAGMWITFAPGAFVWHHRRQTPRAYFRQQSGYGEAEALLQFKHPDKFNGRGDSKWRGVMYGPALRGVRLSRAVIYRGTFGTGLFQCIYQADPAHWAMFPSTFEWHCLAVMVLLMGPLWPIAGIFSALMLALSLAVAIVQAVQATLPAKHDGVWSRGIVAGLCYLQPLVRSYRRYWTRLFGYAPPRLVPPAFTSGRRMPWDGRGATAYWTENGWERTDLLSVFVAWLLEHRWGACVDSGWSDWDVEVHSHPWTLLRVYTAQEDHGGDKLLIRVRYRMSFTALTMSLGTLAGCVACVTAAFHPLAGIATAGLILSSAFGLWWRGMNLAGRVAAGLDEAARTLNAWPCDLSQFQDAAPAASSGEIETLQSAAAELPSVVVPAGEANHG
jgi:GT2 family glycosyltransferase